MENDKEMRRLERERAMTRLRVRRFRERQRAAGYKKITLMVPREYEVAIRGGVKAMIASLQRLKP